MTTTFSIVLCYYTFVLFSAQNRRIKPEQAQKTYERALKLGEEFAEYFTGEKK